jgi:hypothetical protein
MKAILLSIAAALFFVGAAYAQQIHVGCPPGYHLSDGRCYENAGRPPGPPVSLFDYGHQRHDQQKDRRKEEEHRDDVHPPLIPGTKEHR